MDKLHELALDALMTTIDRYGGVWSSDWQELRNDLLAPLVSAIRATGSDYEDVWGPAREVLRKAAGQGRWRN